MNEYGGTLLRIVPSHSSYFLKVDAFPEALVNENQDGRCLNDSCYMNLPELVERAGLVGDPRVQMALDLYAKLS